MVCSFFHTIRFSFVRESRRIEGINLMKSTEQEDEQEMCGSQSQKGWKSLFTGWLNVKLSLSLLADS